MADLFAILTNAASSLAAQRAVTQTAANNVANANTPGYARQSVELQATAPGEFTGGAWLGRGVEIGAVTQSRDRFVEAQLPQTLARAAQSSAESDALSGIHALDPESAGSLASVVGAFYGSLETLSQNPGDSGTRAAALAAARTLAQSFNRTSGQLTEARSGLDARLRGWVDEVNAAARAVAQSNAAIQRASVGGAQPNDLLDARQAQVDKLAALVGGVPVQQADGAVNVVMPGGGALVSGARAGVLSAVPDPSNSGLVAFELGAPDGSKPVPVAPSSLGGSIGGAVAARDGALKTALAGIDALAQDLAGALNGVHAAGYGLDGSTGNPLFGSSTTGPITAGTIRVAITDPRSLATSSSKATLPGDPANALALLATERTALATSKQDVQATLSGVTSGFGAEVQRASAYAEQDDALKSQLVSMRDSASGVSIDEEMIHMQAAQRAYEAIAKVIQVTDEMTQTLIQLGG